MKYAGNLTGFPTGEADGGERKVWGKTYHKNQHISLTFLRLKTFFKLFRLLVSFKSTLANGGLEVLQKTSFF